MDSDPDLEILEKDSGMSSLGGSKDDTPERRAAHSIEDIKEPEQIENKTEDFEDEPDESVQERLWGLTEMFPEPFRKLCGNIVDFTASGVKTCYNFSCNASWIFFTSSMILFAPVIFETERAQMEELQKTQQKQVLLGPRPAINPSTDPLMPPPMMR